MTSFNNSNSGQIIINIAYIIIKNKAYLSQIDGKIGDGDHGVNMAKGFALLVKSIKAKNSSLDVAMSKLSDILMSKIGGSMGPLYGMMFANMAQCIKNQNTIDSKLFLKMLSAGLEGIQDIGSAKLGDKTMLDCLIPATKAFQTEVAKQSSFKDALYALKHAAVAGRDNTINMVAKIGRASRLGERSRGTLDPGATSCCLILNKLADAVLLRL